MFVRCRRERPDWRILLYVVGSACDRYKSHMSQVNQQSAKRKGVPGFVVVIGGIVGLNVLASYSMEAAGIVAASTVLLAAGFFVAAVLRKH